MFDHSLYRHDTFTDWPDAQRWAIRKANLLGCLVGIRWNEHTQSFSLSLVTKIERHERQWVTVVEPGTPHAYRVDFIGPWEQSKRKGV